MKHHIREEIQLYLEIITYDPSINTMDRPKPDALAVCLAHRGLPVRFFPVVQFYLLLSPYLSFISFLYLDLYGLGDDALIS